MMIDRRAFIQCAALVATIPTVANLFRLSPTAQASPVPTASPAARNSTDSNSMVLKIDGWDLSDVKTSAENEVFIRINQSWRTAWR
jgi:hypothetical protein